MSTPDVQAVKLKRAAAKIDRAEERLRQAREAFAETVLESTETMSYAEIGRTVGLSKQRIADVAHDARLRTA